MHILRDWTGMRTRNEYYEVEQHSGGFILVGGWQSTEVQSHTRQH